MQIWRLVPHHHQEVHEVKLPFAFPARSHKTISPNIIAMSLQIPHREKANGASAATKAVILVGFCNENILKGATLTGVNRLVAPQEELDSDHCP
jgi:hypothetical protein